MERAGKPQGGLEWVSWGRGGPSGGKVGEDQRGCRAGCEPDATPSLSYHPSAKGRSLLLWVILAKHQS